MDFIWGFGLGSAVGILSSWLLYRWEWHKLRVLQILLGHALAETQIASDHFHEQLKLMSRKEG